MHPGSIEIQEVNGIQIVKAGGEGPNILFLHDSGQPPAGMKRQILQLAEVGKVVAPNLFDIAGTLARKHIHPTYEDMVWEFNQLELLSSRDKTGIVAVSLGAGFGWEYAAQKPQEVEWITTGSALGYPLHRSLLGWLAEFTRVSVQTARIPKEIRSRDEGIRLIKQQFKKDPRGVLETFRLAMHTDSTEQLKSLQSPVELLWGRNDHYTPIWSAQKMKGLLPNARLEEVSDYYHYWYQFEPEKLTGPAIERARSLHTLNTPDVHFGP